MQNDEYELKHRPPVARKGVMPDVHSVQTTQIR